MKVQNFVKKIPMFMFLCNYGRVLTLNLHNRKQKRVTFVFFSYGIKEIINCARRRKLQHTEN